jgi:hypothetical protein
MISGDSLYMLYTTEFPQVVAGKSVRSRKSHKDRFIKFANKAQDGYSFLEYPTRELAKSYMVSRMGFLEMFFFRALISWIIDKILNYYFGSELENPKSDGRIL